MSNEIVQEDTQEGRFLTFYLGKEIFGVEIRYVTEIIGIQKICELPEAPEFVKGIINLRGNIIPVVNMRLRLGKAEVDNTERTCIIVVDLPETKVGLIVDRVNEVAAISDELIVPPPDIQTGYQNRYIKGIGKLNGEIGLLLDCERLFSDEKVGALKQIEE